MNTRTRTFALAVMALLPTGLIAGEFTRNQLTEGFITYVGRAEDQKVDAQTAAKMRQELGAAKESPVLAPFTFEGEQCDRAALMRLIDQGIGKCRERDVPLTKCSKFASQRKNLESLSDVELVVALRLVEQAVGQLDAAGRKKPNKAEIATPSKPSD